MTKIPDHVWTWLTSITARRTVAALVAMVALVALLAVPWSLPTLGVLLILYIGAGYTAFSA